MVSASVKDVAALAGVSVGTVSNVLNRPEKVSAEVTSRVQSAIDKLGFVRNDAARQLRAGMSHSVGLVVLDAANPFFTDWPGEPRTGRRPNISPSWWATATRTRDGRLPILTCLSSSVSAGC